VLSFLVPFRARRDVLTESELLALREQILQSPYLAGSDLDHGFENTYGFSVLFQRSQLERCLKLLPAARPYLHRVMDRKSQVFFMNPLVIHEGHGVGAHADKTLASFVPANSRVPFPYRVSVLYVGVPPNLRGGELVFHRNAFVRARFLPQVNTLVEFPGWLYHEVKPWKQVGWDGRAAAPRVSLVCEQYRLTPQLLQHVPDFHVETTRDFQGFLDDLLT
jgi:hypothetical protein